MLIFCDLRVLGHLTSGHTELSLSFVAFLQSRVTKRPWLQSSGPGLLVLAGLPVEFAEAAREEVLFDGVACE